jgi:hypothetical protein
MLAHDLGKSPGQYRTGPIYVHDEKRDLVVYEGPDAGRVPALTEELAGSLQADLDVDPLVRGANGTPQPRHDPSVSDDYYQVLAITGQGSWRPRADAHLWAAFNLRAHHMQAQTVARRVGEASEIWGELDTLVRTNNLADRVTGMLYEAVPGYRVRRSGYMKMAEIERTRLAEAG